MADLGYIKTLIINPGHFRTDVAALRKHDAIEESKNYPAFNAFVKNILPHMHGNQPGDAVKAASLTIDLVKGEGVAKGRELPPFLPMGSDAYTDVKAHTEMTLKMLEEWGDVIKSTDVVLN